MNESQITRRHVLGAAMTLTTAAAAARTFPTSARLLHNSGLTRVTTQLEYITDVTFAGWYTAAADGYFRDQGINSVLIPYTSALPNEVSVVAAGRADVATDSLQNVIAANRQGADLVVFGTQYQQSPSGLMSLPEKPIRKIDDVLGKRLGLSPTSRLIINACLDIAGLPHSYTYVAAAGNTQALVDHQVDGVAVFVTSQPIGLDLQGTKNVAVSFSALGFPAYQNVLVTRRSLLNTASTRKILTGYLRAVVKGWEANVADPIAGADLTYSLYGRTDVLVLAQEQKENQAQIPLMQSSLTHEKGLFYMSLDQIAGPQYRVLSLSGIRHLPPVGSYVTLEILRDAFNGKRSLLNN